MDAVKTKLIEAEEKAAQLFQTAEDRGLIRAGRTERQLNEDVFALAKELFGIEKYWHKRIIRSGPNTLQPYNENPPDLVIQENDILFFDFGPIFEDWEADFGRTYVIGNDPIKHKLKNDIELAWHEGKEWFHQRRSLADRSRASTGPADATLTAHDPSTNAPGYLVNGTYVMAQPLQVKAINAANPATNFAPLTSPVTLLTWNAPVSNDAVTVSFKQPIAITDPLRSGSYQKTITFTLTTTSP